MSATTTTSTSAPASPPKKRPYVRPRVGHSMLRSLWYLFAFVGVLVVAFLIPRDGTSTPGLEGNWVVAVQGEVDHLPRGEAHLMIGHRAYSLSFRAMAENAQPWESGMERGEVEESEGQVLLHPRQGVYRSADGTWSEELPESRVFTVSRDSGRLVLTAPGGGTLSTLAGEAR